MNNHLLTTIKFLFKRLQIIFFRLLVCFLVLNVGTSYAAVENIVMTLIPGKDGVAPFDADDLPGHDSSDSNKIVRTHDRFDYRVSYKALDASQVNFVFTAPIGVYWLAVGANTSVCNGSAGPQISGGGRILTCPRKPSVPVEPLTFPQIESFELPAMASNIGNGESVQIQISAGSAVAISESISISAKPKSEIYVLTAGPSKGYYQSEYGALYGINLHFGVKANSSGAAINTIKGIEAPQVPISIDLTDIPEGTVVTSCVTATCTQAGGPGTPITITFTNLNNSLVSPANCSGGLSCTGGGTFSTSFQVGGLYEYAVSRINLFTPFGSSYPSGSKKVAQLHFQNLKPEKSLSNADNYVGTQSGSYAADFSPGYAPGFNTCPDVHSCIQFNIDRTIRTDLYMNFHGTFHTPSLNLIEGDSEASTNNPGDGAESVMPGHLFSVMYPVFTSNQAEEPSTNVGSCVIWNPAKMNLQDAATLKLGVGAEFFRVSHLSFPNVSTDNRIVEYTALSFANDTERKNADCGTAGDGRAEWYADPNAVPGGITEVSGIRYRYLPALQPGTVLGLLMPFRRPTTPYSLGLGTLSLAPWFAQFWSDDKLRVPSQYSGSGYSMWGGRVNTVDALFRHTATMAGSASPGNSLTMTITPIVIGAPILGINATVKNAKIKVNMTDTCLEPVETSLPAFASISTAANYGLDGIPCTGDSGEKPSVLTFSLGDIPAPGGNPSPGYQGHATIQNSFSFDIRVAVNAPVKSVSWSTLDSADNDPTPVTHSQKGSVSISGVAGFLVSKSTTGTTDGKVGPNETYHYLINFGNGGTTVTGKARFVDVLPFDGDSRGTSGLGNGKLLVTGLSASMKSSTQGTVGIEVSFDNPADIENALLQPNNEDGSSGVNWSSYTSASVVPENITAVRFSTSSSLNPGFTGVGSIQVRAPTLKSSSNAFNNVWGRTEAVGGDPGTVKVLNGISLIKIQGLDGGLLRGKVFTDLNANGTPDTGETGLPQAIIRITCTSGDCLTAPQGTVFSVLSDSNGHYSFEPNLNNKIFANNNASGVALSTFDGLVAGVWSVSEVPPSNAPYVNVSTTVGTVNSIVTGQANGRTIQNIRISSNASALNYNFGERLSDGKITIFKNPLTLPNGVTGEFDFTFHATCDLPSIGSVYSATLRNFPSQTSVDIENIPAGAQCKLSETLPSLPSGFAWGTPIISAFNPSGAMTAAGTQTVSVTNEIVEGLTISKSILTAPQKIENLLATYDMEFKVDVINRLTSIQTYSLSDLFGFESDIEIIGSPQISTSANVTSSVNANFSGSGEASKQVIVNNESIEAGSSEQPVVESYVIKLRFRLKEFSNLNNACNDTTGHGLFNTAQLLFGSKTINSTACSATPSDTPVELQLIKKWSGGLTGDRAKIGATTNFTSANTLPFESTNSILINADHSSSEKISLFPNEIGQLPRVQYQASTTESAEQVANRYHTSQWICSDGVRPSLTVNMGGNLEIPSESIGKTLLCTITSQAITIGSSKTSVPASGSVVAVNDEITYKLRTEISGGAINTDLVLTDTLDTGLTLLNYPKECRYQDNLFKCILPAGSVGGVYTFTYTAKVNSKAIKNKPAGVKNSLNSSFGQCSPCSTFHGLWSAKISKTSNADTQGVYVGDRIQYTILVEISGGTTTQEIILTDTRSIGLQLDELPKGCSQKQRTMTCKLPAGSAPGVYSFVYTALVTDDAKSTVSNSVVSPSTSCKNSCSTESKVIRKVVLRISKSAQPNRVKFGDFVRYEILVENLTGPTANDFLLIDQPAPGLNYVSGSAEIKGDDNWQIKSTYPLIFSRLNLEKNKSLVISYWMRVGAGTGRGCVNNSAQVDDERKEVSSNPSSICVSRLADPDFEDSRILGTVFNDKNGNGVQDEVEEGLPGIRLVSPNGQVIETDSYGRYHIEGIDPGALSRGRNFVIMLDESTLTKGAVLTTQNPLVKRVTWAIPVQFNFGVRQQLNKVNLSQISQEETASDSEPQEVLSDSALDTKRTTTSSELLALNRHPNTSKTNTSSEVAITSTKKYVIKTDGLFQFGQSDELYIIPPGLEQLKAFAEQIQTEFSVVENIVLRAHTDRIGNNENNLLLSYQRAETIKRLLIKEGIQTKVFDLNGVGSAEPVVYCPGASNEKTIRCLAPNRRFEVLVTGEPHKQKVSP